MSYSPDLQNRVLILLILVVIICKNHWLERSASCSCQVQATTWMMYQLFLFPLFRSNLFFTIFLKFKLACAHIKTIDTARAACDKQICTAISARIASAVYAWFINIYKKQYADHLRFSLACVPLIFQYVSCSACFACAVLGWLNCN